MNGPGSQNAEFGVAPDTDVTVLPVPATPDPGRYFAGSPGAVHSYGLARPVPL